MIPRAAAMLVAQAVHGRRIDEAALGRTRVPPHRSRIGPEIAFEPLLYGVGLAIVLTLILRETGSAAVQPRTPAPVREAT